MVHVLLAHVTSVVNYHLRAKKELNKNMWVIIIQVFKHDFIASNTLQERVESRILVSLEISVYLFIVHLLIVRVNVMLRIETHFYSEWEMNIVLLFHLSQNFCFAIKCQIIWYWAQQCKNKQFLSNLYFATLKQYLNYIVFNI